MRIHHAFLYLLPHTYSKLAFTKLSALRLNAIPLLKDHVSLQRYLLREGGVNPYALFALARSEISHEPEGRDVPLQTLRVAASRPNRFRLS